MSRDLPAPFADPMVLQIADDAKWQTRRIISPQPSNPGAFGVSPIWGSGVPNRDRLKRFHIHAAFNVGGKREDRWLPCRYGAPGDLLWVQESVRARDTFSKTRGRPEHTFRAEVTYRADNSTRIIDVPCEHWRCSLETATADRFRAPRFMPKWAARTWLEVTGIRVERLHDITEEDAKAEGCAGGHDAIPGYNFSATPGEHFRHLWKTINGADSWDANPWVWVVSFKRAERKAVAA